MKSRRSRRGHSGFFRQYRYFSKVLGNHSQKDIMRDLAETSQLPITNI